MKRITYNSLIPFGECICSREVSSVYRLDENSVLKLFDVGFLTDLLDNDYDIEEKVLNGSRLVHDSSIVVPDCSVYRGSRFIGYTMPYINGISIMNYINDNMSLKELTLLYSKIESIVRDNDNVVFPDMLSDGNIIIDCDGFIKFIDFDGLQVSNYLTPAISSGLGCKAIYNYTKYKKGLTYTKELDIKSLIYLYFSMVFAYPLEDIDNGCFECSNEELLFDLFTCLGIEDADLFDKVLRLYNDGPNMYLDDTVYSILDNYNLDVINNENEYVKRLVRK